MFQLQFFFAPLWRMGPRCSSAETQVCHRSYIIAAKAILKNWFDVSQLLNLAYVNRHVFFLSNTFKKLTSRKKIKLKILSSNFFLEFGEYFSICNFCGSLLLTKKYFIGGLADWIFVIIHLFAVLFRLVHGHDWCCIWQRIRLSRSDLWCLVWPWKEEASSGS